MQRSVIIWLFCGSLTWTFVVGCGKQERSTTERAAELARHGEWTAAIDVCTTVLASDPTSADALKTRGTAYTATKQLQEAVADYSKLIELRPDDSEGYYRRAMVYEMLGKEDLAAADEASARERDETIGFITPSIDFSSGAEMPGAEAILDGESAPIAESWDEAYARQREKAAAAAAQVREQLESYEAEMENMDHSPAVPSSVLLTESLRNQSAAVVAAMADEAARMGRPGDGGLLRSEDEEATEPSAAPEVPQWQLINPIGAASPGYTFGNYEPIGVPPASQVQTGINSKAIGGFAAPGTGAANAGGVHLPTTGVSTSSQTAPAALPGTVPGGATQVTGIGIGIGIGMGIGVGTSVMNTSTPGQYYPGPVYQPAQQAEALRQMRPELRAPNQLPELPSTGPGNPLLSNPSANFSQPILPGVPRQPSRPGALPGAGLGVGPGVGPGGLYNSSVPQLPPPTGVVPATPTTGISFP